MTTIIMSDDAPRPIVYTAEMADLDWSPVAMPLYTNLMGVNVRAGNTFAIVRPGYERWPLGVVTDTYKVVGHTTVSENVLQSNRDAITPAGKPYMCAHGYHIAYGYTINHMRSDKLAGLPVYSRLVVAVDHTGKNALRAAMVVYVGKEPIGAIVRSRGIHVAANPTVWHAAVEAMVERAIIVQDPLIALLTKAHAHSMSDDDFDILRKEDICPRDKVATTLLQALQSWFHKPATGLQTWGIWERRLDNSAIRAMRLFYPTEYEDVMTAMKA